MRMRFKTRHATQIERRHSVQTKTRTGFTVIRISNGIYHITLTIPCKLACQRPQFGIFLPLLTLHTFNQQCSYSQLLSFQAQRKSKMLRKYRRAITVSSGNPHTARSQLLNRCSADK